MPGPVLYVLIAAVALFLRAHPSVPGSWHTGEHPSDGTKVLGGLGPVIHLGDVAPGPHLVEELLAGQEPVHQEVECLVQPVQEIDFFLCVMSVIPHELPDDRVVLLFHMGIVILVIGTGTGEGDPTGTTETDEVAVHELASVVRMERDDLPRIPAEALSLIHISEPTRPY